MKTITTKKLLALLVTAVLIITTAHAQTTTALDDYILDKMKDHQLPGVAFALIKDGKIALTKGYGYANIDKDIPYTPNTIQEIASISKPVTATAIMKLWEQGLFQLDDPINNYLPFPVTNPFYPGTPITFRMLLNHTSSVNFGFFLSNGILAQHRVAPGTAEELGSFLQSYFVPGGSLYIDSISYYHLQPGTQYVYSNFGYALLGYLVEQISGMPFNEYCNQNIFQPLCMTSTAWYYSELDTNIVSRPYHYKSSTSKDPIDFFGLFEWNEYPSVQLKSTVLDLSKFMLMHLNYGILDGIRIIDSTTEVKMRTIQVTTLNITVDHDNQPLNFQQDECLGLEHVTEYSNNNEEVFGKGGGDIGVNSHTWFNTSDNTVVTVLSNELNFEEQASAILDIHIQLDEFVADTISTSGTPVLNCSYLLNPCQHSINYWKNNSPEWALNGVPMKLGTKHYYSKNQMLDLLNRAVNGDASILLAKSLIATKLNVAQGSELSPIVLTINAAMSLIGNHRLPYDNPVSFSSATGVQMLALAATLDSYNAGAMNVTACSGSSEKDNVDGDTIDSYSLSNSPNPFSEMTVISFSLPQSEMASLKIFDMNGRLVKTLVDRELANGEHQIEWNAEDVIAGIYFLRVETASYSENKKLIVAK